MIAFVTMDKVLLDEADNISALSKVFREFDIKLPLSNAQIVLTSKIFGTSYELKTFFKMFLRRFLDTYFIREI